MKKRKQGGKLGPLLDSGGPGNAAIQPGPSRAGARPAIKPNKQKQNLKCSSGGSSSGPTPRHDRAGASAATPAGALRCTLEVPPLPIPCVYYDGSFLSRETADAYCSLLKGSVPWASNKVSRRRTALFGDAGLEYHGPRRSGVEDDGVSKQALPAIGYASDHMHAWSPPILELKSASEAWHLQATGRSVRFCVCLLNLYGPEEELGWHADREEMDPALGAPRSSPIVSISLGATRLFGLRLKSDTEGRLPPLSLGHGSILVMENACQLLYHHSVLPATGPEKGERVNLTFRANTGVEPYDARAAPPRALPAAASAKFAAASSVAAPLLALNGPVFVGLTSAVDHTPKAPGSAHGFKQRLHHPFETPFVTGGGEEAAARYRSWLASQPLFHAWVVARLRGKELCGGSEKKKKARDAAHVRALADEVAGRR